MSTLQIAYNVNTKVATVQDEEDTPPAGSVIAGTIDSAAYDTLYSAIRDLLYRCSAIDPSEPAMYPNSIFDMSNVSIVMGVGTIEDLELTAAELDDGEEGTPYTFTVQFVGGIPPYTFALVDPPEGMEIDPATGVVTWEEPLEDDYTIEVTLTDGAETEVSEEYELTIAAAP